MTVIYEDFSPVYQGDTSKPFAPTVQEIDSTTGLLAPFDLTGLTISMRMVNTDTQAVIVCAGTWTIDVAASGTCHYGYQAADVATPGIYQMQMKFTDGGGNFVHGDVKLLQIKPAL